MIALFQASTLLASVDHCVSSVLEAGKVMRELDVNFGDGHHVSSPIRFLSPHTIVAGTGTLIHNPDAQSASGRTEGNVRAWNLRTGAHSAFFNSDEVRFPMPINLQLGISSNQHTNLLVQTMGGPWGVIDATDSRAYFRHGAEVSPGMFLPILGGRLAEPADRVLIQNVHNAEVWDANSGKRVFELTSPVRESLSREEGEPAFMGTPTEWTSHEIIADGRFILGLYAFSQKLRLWDPQSGEIVFEQDFFIESDAGQIQIVPSRFGLEFAVVSTRDRVGGYEHKIEIWRIVLSEQREGLVEPIVERVLVKNSRGPLPRPMFFEFMPEGFAAFMSAETSDVEIYNLYVAPIADDLEESTDYAQRFKNPHSEEVLGLWVLNDGTLVTSSFDQSIAIWPGNKSHRPFLIQGFGAAVFAVSASDDSSRLALRATNQVNRQTRHLEPRPGGELDIQLLILDLDEIQAP